MEHVYEIRKLEDDGSTKTIDKFVKEPMDAKRRAKSYAERHPGLYTLYRVETVEIYFTEKGRE